MPAVPRRPGPRRSARQLRSGLVRVLHGDQGKGGGEGYGDTVRGAAPPQGGTGPDGPQAGRWIRSRDGSKGSRPPEYPPAGEPACWLASVCVLLG